MLQNVTEYISEHDWVKDSVLISGFQYGSLRQMCADARVGIAGLMGLASLDTTDYDALSAEGTAPPVLTS